VAASDSSSSFFGEPVSPPTLAADAAPTSIFFFHSFPMFVCCNSSECRVWTKNDTWWS